MSADALRTSGGRLAARLLRTGPWRHSGFSTRRVGPPTGATTTADLRGRTEVLPGTAQHRADWSSLRYDDGEAIRFVTAVPAVFPRRDVVLLRRGRVFSEHGWPVTAGGEVVLDSAFVHEDARFRAFERDTGFRRLVKLPGDVLNLTSAWAHLNYGHALLDAVGRLAVVHAAGLTADHFDRFLVPAYRSSEVASVLDRAGVPEDRRIAVGTGTNIQAERLWITGFPGEPRCYPPAVPEFLRGLLTEEERGGDRRVWLSRPRGKRALANHAEAEALVRSYGYEPVDPAAGDALLVLARASHVVGVHGAALSSIAVASPGTRVVEILPTGHRYPYFATLAVSAGHRYTAIPGESVSDERDADFTVDLRRLDAVLAAEHR